MKKRKLCFICFSFFNPAKDSDCCSFFPSKILKYLISKADKTIVGFLSCKCEMLKERKINPIMQTKVFNQRKPQNSLNGFSNPLFKQQSTQDVFEKEISFEKKFKILLSEDETDIFSSAEIFESRLYTYIL